MHYQPYMTAADGQRTFACSPAAVLVFIINAQEEILLLAHPKRGGSWEVVNGALNAGETVLDCAFRESYEEAGAQLQLEPLGTVHISTFHYDQNVQFMLSIGYLMAYRGGIVQPGDDMAGSAFRWWRVDELANEEVKLLIPPDGKWLIERAVELYRLWHKMPPKRDLIQPLLVVPSAVKPK